MTRPALTCCLLATLTSVYAQKVEREYEIGGDEVPEAIPAFLDSAYAKTPPERLRFYRDVGEDGATVEAKFKIDGTRYSVEFADDGAWLDTEVEVPIDEIDDAVWDRAACARWTDTFELFRVVRVQHHRGADGAEYYEAELRVRVDREWLGYEYQLGLDGEILAEKEILLSPGHLSRW